MNKISAIEKFHFLFSHTKNSY